MTFQDVGAGENKCEIQTVEKIVSAKCYGEKTKNGDIPKDCYRITYVTFFFVGIFLLLPFNFFTTASDYWMYKFRNTSLDDPLDVNARTTLQVQFASWVTIVSQVTSVGFLFLVTVFNHKVKARITIIGSVLISLVLFVLVAVFVVVDTDEWQSEFFILTMTLVALINAMRSVFTVTIYAIIVRFPHEYISPYLIGQGTAGLFSAVLQIASISLGTETKKSALIYFWCGVAFIAITLALYIISEQTQFFRYYSVNFKETKRQKFMSLKEYGVLTKEIWTSMATMIFVIFTMMPVYPAVAILVASEGDPNATWNAKYFTPVATYLIFYICDITGRTVESFLKKSVNPVVLVILSFLRFCFFVPAIMFCNARPRNNLPVLFPKDWQYITIIALFGATNGYFNNICYTNINKLVGEGRAKDAFSVLSTSNGFAFALASLLSHVCVDMVQNL